MEVRLVMIEPILTTVKAGPPTREISEGGLP